MAKPGPKRRPLVERFWAKVDKKGPGECWEWTASLNNKGYGMIGRSGRRGTVLAHRVSWELANGPIPEGMCVLHHCDVRSCVNPHHLFLGTNKDNTCDAITKGRWVYPPHLYGEGNGFAKLTEQDVHEIRAMLARKVPQGVIAKKYKVHRSTIRLIEVGKNWSWLKEV